MQKNADISKIKTTLVLKGIFFETTYSKCLCAKFEVSNITLTSFKTWGYYYTPTLKQTPENPTQIRVKEKEKKYSFENALVEKSKSSTRNRNGY